MDVLRGHPANRIPYLSPYLPTIAETQIKKLYAYWLGKDLAIAESPKNINKGDYTSLHYFKIFKKKCKHLLNNLENCQIDISIKK